MTSPATSKGKARAKGARDTVCKCQDIMSDQLRQLCAEGTAKSLLASCTYDGHYHDCVCDYLLNFAPECQWSGGGASPLPAARKLCRAPSNWHIACVCHFVDPATCDAARHLCCCRDQACGGCEKIDCRADVHACVCDKARHLCLVHDGVAEAVFKKYGGGAAAKKTAKKAEEEGGGGEPSAPKRARAGK